MQEIVLRILNIIKEILYVFSMWVMLSIAINIIIQNKINDDEI